METRLKLIRLGFVFAGLAGLCFVGSRFCIDGGGTHFRQWGEGYSGLAGKGSQDGFSLTSAGFNAGSSGGYSRWDSERGKWVRENGGWDSTSGKWLGTSAGWDAASGKWVGMNGGREEDKFHSGNREPGGHLISASMQTVSPEAIPKIERAALTTKVDLGKVTFSLDLKTAADSPGGNFNIQIFLLDGKRYQTVAPRDDKAVPVQIALFPGGSDNRYQFTMPMPKGTYSKAFYQLFAEGTNYQTPIFGQNMTLEMRDFTVSSDLIRISSPTLELIDADRVKVVVPSSTQITSGSATTLMASSDTDLRYPQKPGDPKQRFVPIWYDDKRVSISYFVNDGQAHFVTVYCLNPGSDETFKVELLDEAGKSVSDKTVKGVLSGVFVTLPVIKGQQTIRVTAMENSPNAVITGLFFDSQMPTLPAKAEGGNWIGKLGKDGYFFAGSDFQNPGYLGRKEGADRRRKVGYRVKWPADFQWPGGYCWVQMQGDATFQQQAVVTGSANTATGPDAYHYADGVFGFEDAQPGIKQVSFGLYDSGFHQVSYLWQAYEWEVGGDSWIAKADPARYPSLKAALQKGKAPFFIWGNFGNSLLSVGRAANVDAGYFSLLRHEVGLPVLRITFWADKIVSDPIHAHLVDEEVQTLLRAGVVPFLSPQHVTDGDADKLIKGLEFVCRKYRNVPLAIDIANEPFQFSTWAAWKPVAIRAARAVRAIKPDAYVVCPFEGYSKDGRAASADPLPEGLVDAYAWHAYLRSDELRTFAPKGIPFLVEESFDPTPEFNSIIQSLKPVGYMAWAWTTPGQDVLNLVQSVNGASLRLSPTGETLREDYAAWRRGESIRAGTSVGVSPGKGNATNEELAKRVETLEATVKRLEKIIKGPPGPQ